MDLGEQLIRWTIRLSMLCYALFLISNFAGWQGGWSRIRRFLWISGAGWMLAHLVCAFQFYHHWSNASAVAATAEETNELLGFEFGAGVYFSYVFAAIWAVDAAWWLVRPQQYERRAKWLATIVHSYIFFIAVNGTIVFETGVTRWAGVLVCLILLACLGRSLAAAKQPAISAKQQAT